MEEEYDAKFAVYIAAEAFGPRVRRKKRVSHHARFASSISLPPSSYLTTHPASLLTRLGHKNCTSSNLPVRQIIDCLLEIV